MQTGAAVSPTRSWQPPPGAVKAGTVTINGHQRSIFVLITDGEGHTQAGNLNTQAAAKAATLFQAVIDKHELRDQTDITRNVLSANDTGIEVSSGLVSYTQTHESKNATPEWDLFKQHVLGEAAQVEEEQFGPGSRREEVPSRVLVNQEASSSPVRSSSNPRDGEEDAPRVAVSLASSADGHESDDAIVGGSLEASNSHRRRNVAHIASQRAIQREDDSHQTDAKSRRLRALAVQRKAISAQQQEGLGGLPRHRKPEHLERGVDDAPILVTVSRVNEVDSLTDRPVYRDATSATRNAFGLELK